jgi:mannan endo-1,4-beta-mannosidase
VDHGKAQATVGKPVLFEEYGWLNPANKLAWLGVTANPNETRVSVMSEWQKLSLNYSMSNMYWQLGVCGLSFGCSTDDGFTIYLNNTTESTPLVYEDAAAVNKANKNL